MKTIIIMSILMLGGYYFYGKQSIKEEDIYVNRLIYSKSDSSLLTGTLEIRDKASYWFESYCKGIPCGRHAEQQNGGNYISKGEYLDQSILSVSTQHLIGTDTFLIDHWQEGGDVSTDPYYMSVIILKDDVFFLNKNDYSGYTKQLAQALMNDTRHLKYNEISIYFVNAFRTSSKEYYKTYHIKNGELREVKQE